MARARDYLLMRLYHETARENVASILNDGFRDAGPEPRVPGFPYGVYVADQPPRLQSGDKRALIAIEAGLSDEELNRYAYNHRAWPPHGNQYREWCVPARRLNEFSRREMKA